MTKYKIIITLVLLGGILFAAAACGPKSPAAEEIQAPEAAAEEAVEEAQPVESAPEAEAEPAEAQEEPAPPPQEPEAAIPVLLPGEPPVTERTLEDSDSSIRASENRTLSGDNILNNLFERPFTAWDMVYQPELDIYTVDIAYEGDFFYFTITLNGMELDANIIYGIEFDRTKTGRGDLLVLVRDPGEEWSLDRMIVLEDEDGDVGGIKPIVADEGFEGNGYDQRVELGAERLAFARISPDDPHAVQIAVSLALLDYPEQFLYGAWVDGAMQDFSMFDYNDAIGPGEAGSPMKDSADYPIKALYSLDNTCRLPFGFEQGSESVPGMCINVAPAPEGCVRYCVTPCYVKVGCCEWGCR